MNTNTSKYKAIFDVAPIPIWEEDFSEVKKYLLEKGLYGKPTAIIFEYLNANPSFIQDCVQRLIITDINQACVDLHDAKSKEELLTNFHRLIIPEAVEAFKKQIYSICKGDTAFQTESKMLTLDGEYKTILLKWKAVPGFEESLQSVIVTTQDITHQQNALDKQKSIELKLNEAQKIAKVGYWELELKTDTLFWSDEIFNIWEMEGNMSELTLEKFHQSIHPDDLAEFDKNQKRAIRGLAPLDVIHRIITSSGNVKWVHEKGNITNDSEGNPHIFNGTVQDITPSELLKQGLEELLERYHFVTKATSEAIWDWDINSGNVFWGEGYRNIFGYKTDQTKHNFSNWKNNIHPEDCERVSRSIQLFLEGNKENWQENYRFKNKNGTYSFVLDKGIAIRDKNGKAYRMIGAVQDITEAKKASDELHSRSQFIQTTLDNIPIGIAVNQMDSGKATLMNKKFSEIYGWPEDELQDVESFFEKVYPDDHYRQQMKETITSDIQSGDTEKMTWNGIHIMTKSGQQKIISAKNIPLYSQNLMISTVIDETNRFLAEQALIDSNERFLHATHAVSDAIWDWNVTTGKLFWGNGYKTLFGYPLESDCVDVSAWSDAIHPEDRDKIIASFADAKNNPSENRWSGEYRFKKYNGTYAFVKEKTIILRNENGKPTRLVGAIQDISEQKKHVEALSNERNLLRTLIDNIPDYIYVKDLNSRHVVNNQANIKLLGASNEADTLGKTAFDYFPEKLAKIYFEDDKHVLETKKPIINREEPIVDKKGNQRWLSTSKVPLFDIDGNSIGLLGISKDITFRKINEHSLIKKTRFLETIAEVVKLLLSNENHEEVLPDCLELMGNAVGADRVNLFENFNEQTTNKIFARQVMEWTNGKVSPQITNKKYQAVDLGENPLFLKFLTSNLPFSQLKSDLDGEPKRELDDRDIKSILQMPIFLEDRFYGFMGFDDCTNYRVWSNEEISFLRTLTSNLGSAIERKKNLDQLNALNSELQNSNNELASSNRQLEQFAHVASHDLQEPLRMISSFLILIEKKYNSQLDQKGKEYIHFAVEGAKRMKQIIRDMLEYSRVGRISGHAEQIDLNAIMEEITVLINAVHADKKAKVFWDKLPVIHSEKSQIHQVFQNLILNALKYHKEGVSPIVHISSVEHQKHWEFTVSDNGIGIAPEYHEKIFVIFQRLHSKNEFSGTGIGLAICKKIIEGMGGKIWIESDLGHGSIFHINIPK